MGSQQYLTDETANLLNEEGAKPISIMPNGELRTEKDVPSDIVPSTIENDLGGEYA